jgi:hypothetical protein
MACSAPLSAMYPDVVARHGRPRAVLSPARHPPVDQPGIARQARPRPDSEPLGDPGTIALEQDVGRLDERQHHFRGLGPAQVDDHSPPAPARDVERREGGGFQRGRPIDAQHLGAHVRQQHRGRRTRSDAGEFEHPYPRKRPRSPHQNVLSPALPTSRVKQIPLATTGCVWQMMLLSAPGWCDAEESP